MAQPDTEPRSPDEDNKENVKTENKFKSKDEDNKYKKKNTGSGSHSMNYTGENNEIGVILALRNEKYSNKVMYTTFVDRMRTYVLTNFNNARDMIPILDKLEDPKTALLGAQPKDLTDKEKGSDVQVYYKQEEVKKYIKRLTNLENNKETLYGLVWGQCSSGLQEIVKADDEFHD